MLPFLSPEPQSGEGCAAFWLRLHSDGRGRAAYCGSEEAAEPNTHNGSPGGGRGGGCSEEAGSLVAGVVGGWEGTKERQGRGRLS